MLEQCQMILQFGKEDQEGRVGKNSKQEENLHFLNIFL